MEIVAVCLLIIGLKVIFGEVLEKIAGRLAIIANALENEKKNEKEEIEIEG